MRQTQRQKIRIITHDKHKDRKTHQNTRHTQRQKTYQNMRKNKDQSISKRQK
jgi:hypothetical protein